MAFLIKPDDRRFFLFTSHRPHFLQYLSPLIFSTKKNKKKVRESLLFLTKKQKTTNKRIFAFLNTKKQKKTRRESLLFLTKKQKTKNKRIFDFHNKKTHKKQKQKSLLMGMWLCGFMRLWVYGSLRYIICICPELL